MDWNAAIEKNRDALKRVLAGIEGRFGKQWPYMGVHGGALWRYVVRFRPHA
jgi:hypothetical protein